MPTPLVCTTNSFGSIDYGVPIVANKFTDYRTSTGTYHRLVPNKPQDFDCRVKLPVRPELLETNVAIRDEVVKSTYDIEYFVKGKYNDPNVNYGNAKPAKTVAFGRNVQEMMFKNPPKPNLRRLSEMKDTYRLRQPESKVRVIFPPEPYEKCLIKGLGRDEQPSIPPELPGYWRWMDPYLTTNRAMHVPFTIDQQNGIARKDILTFYDIYNYPKAKGFGPKNPPGVEPLVSQRQRPIFDKLIASKPLYDRSFSKAWKRIPHFGKQSEMKGSYTTQTYSDLYPYMHAAGEEFPDALPKASAWQDLAAPAMYCTEYCHTGTGWPVNAALDVSKPKDELIHKPEIIHKQCYFKFKDDSQ